MRAGALAALREGKVARSTRQPCPHAAARSAVARGARGAVAFAVAVYSSLSPWRVASLSFATRPRAARRAGLRGARERAGWRAGTERSAGPARAGRSPRGGSRARLRARSAEWLYAQRGGRFCRAPRRRARSAATTCGGAERARYRVEAWCIYGSLYALLPSRCAARWLHDACRSFIAARSVLRPGRCCWRCRCCVPAARPRAARLRLELRAALRVA